MELFLRYCAALLQIKYLKYDVDVKWGTKKPDLIENFNVLKEHKAKKDITNCRRIVFLKLSLSRQRFQALRSGVFRSTKLSISTELE